MLVGHRVRQKTSGEHAGLRRHSLWRKLAGQKGRCSQLRGIRSRPRRTGKTVRPGEWPARSHGKTTRRFFALFQNRRPRATERVGLVIADQHVFRADRADRGRAA